MSSGPGLTPDDERLVREKARRMVGLGVVHQIQLIARRYQEEEEFKRKAATLVALVCAALIALGAIFVVAAPGVLEALFRTFS